MLRYFFLAAAEDEKTHNKSLKAKEGNTAEEPQEPVFDLEPLSYLQADLSILELFTSLDADDGESLIEKWVTTGSYLLCVNLNCCKPQILHPKQLFHIIYTIEHCVQGFMSEVYDNHPLDIEKEKILEAQKEPKDPSHKLTPRNILYLGEYLINELHKMSSIFHDRYSKTKNPSSKQRRQHYCQIGGDKKGFYKQGYFPRLYLRLSESK
jgi:hypothetical protein